LVPTKLTFGFPNGKELTPEIKKLARGYFPKFGQKKLGGYWNGGLGFGAGTQFFPTFGGLGSKGLIRRVKTLEEVVMGIRKGGITLTKLLRKDI